MVVVFYINLQFFLIIYLYMLLKKLLESVSYELIGNLNTDIQSLFFDSRKTVKNGLFFCLQGVNTNGVNFVKQAQNNGAIAIVCNKQINSNLTQIIVEDVRKTMAIVSANFYDNPQQKLKIVGITGTSGKTSTSYIIADILKYNNKQVGVIGTSGIFINNKLLSAKLTTPDSIELFEILSQMVKNNIEYVVMEVSAHAIFYNKIYGINFTVKVLTNIKSDHLDFFKNDTEYQNTKLSFFNNYGKNIVNGDDDICYQLKQKYPQNTISFGNNKYNNFLIRDVNCLLSQTSFNLISHNKNLKLKSNLIGVFNVYNIACAVCVIDCLDTKLQVQNAIINLQNISGRMQNLNFGQLFKIFVDYAHTVDSLKNFLVTITNLSSNKNIVVFGCPGERDTYKRKQMGALASRFCDVIILTTDNPASENSRRIMWEIMQGVDKSKAKVYFIENRKLAIKKAINYADNNTNILVVGKGSEDCQIVGDKRLPYSDIQTIKTLFGVKE